MSDEDVFDFYKKPRSYQKFRKAQPPAGRSRPPKRVDEEEVSASLPFDEVKRRDFLKVPSRPKPVRFQPKAAQEETKKAQEEAPEYATLFRRLPIKITKRKTQEVVMHVIEPIATKRLPLVDIKRGPLVDWDKTTESPTVPEFYGLIPYAGPSSIEGPPHISKTPSGHDIYIGLYTDLKRRMAILENTTDSLCEDLEKIHDDFAENFRRASLYTQQLNEMIGSSLKRHQDTVKLFK